MQYIYTLLHSGETIPEEEWDHEFFKILGYFFTPKKALQAIAHYKKLPGFTYHTKVYAEPNQDVERKPGFYVLKEPTNLSFWKAGYSPFYPHQKDDDSTSWTRKINLPYWLKNKKLDTLSSKDLQKLFIEEYGPQKYPKGLGTEFYLANLFIELPTS